MPPEVFFFNCEKNIKSELLDGFEAELHGTKNGTEKSFINSLHLDLLQKSPQNLVYEMRCLYRVLLKFRTCHSLNTFLFLRFLYRTFCLQSCSHITMERNNEIVQCRKMAKRKLLSIKSTIELLMWMGQKRKRTYKYTHSTQLASSVAVAFRHFKKFYVLLARYQNTWLSLHFCI